MCEHFKGLGITDYQLEPGTVVMVPVGRLVAHINGDPVLIAWATVIGPADNGRVWLDVYSTGGGDPLPQMYDPREILGIPALGLSMRGAPELIL